MNLKHYLTSEFLFQINTAYISPQEKLVLALGGALVLLAIVFKISARLAPTPADGKYRNKFYNLFLTIGASFVVWFGMRYENARFFGSHFVVLLLAVIGVIWFVAILVGAFRKYRTEKQTWEKEQLKLRYLPK